MAACAVLVEEPWAVRERIIAEERDGAFLGNQPRSGERAVGQSIADPHLPAIHTDFRRQCGGSGRGHVEVNVDRNIFIVRLESE